MSNMSYCRFRNTYSDLEDCIYALNDEGLPKSGEERSAAKRMKALCEEYLDAYEEALDFEEEKKEQEEEEEKISEKENP